MSLAHRDSSEQSRGARLNLAPSPPDGRPSPIAQDIKFNSALFQGGWGKGLRLYFGIGDFLWGRGFYDAIIRGLTEAFIL
jgi:hypothetical protein